MNRGAWQAAIHGVAKSRARLSDFHSLSEDRCGAAPYCRQDACLDTGAPPLSGCQRLGEARLTAQMLLPACAALSRIINLGGKAKICKRTGESFQERFAQRTLVVVRFQKTDDRVPP